MLEQQEATTAAQSPLSAARVGLLVSPPPVAFSPQEAQPGRPEPQQLSSGSCTGTWS